ncbi:hypothetical protein GcM3_148007 [Golovinomyces cichoracearum]|uniref:Uncharacterized protein n=1 Tax=Golovinomyces cichoracearum TaxID=62708 RepID=A0A420HY59_9PEZI|nr:hypothetical protein GcM3_148007 [Golovinomyces cichoracearum]
MASKAKLKVNPILKKWTQNEENTLDLDLSNDIRDTLSKYDLSKASRPTNDIDNSPTSNQGYHNRSASGASQYSVATAGSGHRTGSFVHPFQQTPRPFTPPFVNSTLESFRSNDLTSSSVDEEADQRYYQFYTSASNSSSYRSQPLARASTSAHTPHHTIHPKISSSRLALVSSYTNIPSQINLNEDSSFTNFPQYSSGNISSEKGFRLRSRSEVIIRGRAQSIQEARRKFLEKEIVQEEKAAREEIKQLEKRQQKEAMKIERSNRQPSVSDASRSKRSKSDLTVYETAENFLNGADDIDTDKYSEAEPGRRRNGSLAKQKTHSAWAIFLMWFRTRLIRFESKISSKS